MGQKAADQEGITLAAFDIPSQSQSQMSGGAKSGASYQKHGERDSRDRNELLRIGRTPVLKVCRGFPYVRRQNLAIGGKHPNIQA